MTARSAEQLLSSPPEPTTQPIVVRLSTRACVDTRCLNTHTHTHTLTHTHTHTHPLFLTFPSILGQSAAYNLKKEADRWSEHNNPVVSIAKKMADHMASMGTLSLFVLQLGGCMRGVCVCVCVGGGLLLSEDV